MGGWLGANSNVYNTCKNVCMLLSMLSLLSAYRIERCSKQTPTILACAKAFLDYLSILLHKYLFTIYDMFAVFSGAH